jgi:hypothetical protein
MTLATGDTNIGIPSACMLSGIYTFNTLPSLSASTSGTTYTALTSDQGLCHWTGAGWQPLTPTAINARRQKNIANFLAGPMIAAPTWAATTAYVAGAVVTIANGQHIVNQVAGTSSATEPVFSATVLDGRPVVDGGCTWYGLPYYQSSNQLGAPTITVGANAAALGLTETQFIVSGVINPKCTGYGAFLGVNVGPVGYLFATGNSLSSGNATSTATAAGYSNAYAYNVIEYDMEFYVTDSFFGITGINSSNPLTIEVDGVLVSVPGTNPGGTNGNCIAFNFNGIVKRRLIRFPGYGQGFQIRGVALSPIGTWEASDTPQDPIVIFGDSITGTIGGTYTLTPNSMHSFQGYLKRLLGVGGIWAAGVAGSGYYNANANTYNCPASLANPSNIAMLALINPGHLIFNQGINDAVDTQSLVMANALASWKAARLLCPKAKITVTDGFSQATGPGAANFTQAQNLLTQFNAWGDPNSRFIQSTSLTQNTAWTQGTANAGNAIAVGNSCNYVSTDGIHPTPIGAYYLATRMANAMNLAWNGNY